MGWDDNGDGYGGYGYAHHMSGWGIGVMALMIVLSIVAVILIVRALVGTRSTSCESCAQNGGESARAILDRRFAEGKIKRKKYLEAKELLS